MTESGIEQPFAGCKEGVARMMSQSATYLLEVRKSLFQIHGNTVNSALTPVQWWTAFHRGVWQSSLSAGLVYGLYYKVYHTCVMNHQNALEANAVATFVTSLVKIPLSNAIRWMQLNPTKKYHIGMSMAHIYKRSQWRGLYSGYGLSFIEDFIEMALRDTLFAQFDQWNSECKWLRSHEIGFVGGALSGSAVAFATTPFDTLRCHLTYLANIDTLRGRGIVLANVFSPLHTTRQLIADHGLGLFYRGARTRAISTGLRMAFFYTFMKICA